MTEFSNPPKGMKEFEAEAKKFEKGSEGRWEKLREMVARLMSRDTEGDVSGTRAAGIVQKASRGKGSGSEQE